MAMFQVTKTVGEYVKEKPALSRVFDRYGIDYCCGGKRPLLEVCHDRGISVDEVVSALEQATESKLEDEDLDWQTATVEQMIDHIHSHHHLYLYEVMPRLSQMVNKVARVHGAKDARLAELAIVFETLQTELNLHMQKEERVLFPLCRELATANVLPQSHCGSIGNPIRVMGVEHEQAGALLAKMHILTNDFAPPEWACNTYRAMLDGLAEMEQDLHQHIHEENNILFPKALQMSCSLEKSR